MDEATRKAVFIAPLEGIASARTAVAHEGLSPLDEAVVMADVALKSLEGAGFKIVRADSQA